MLKGLWVLDAVLWESGGGDYITSFALWGPPATGGKITIGSDMLIGSAFEKFPHIYVIILTCNEVIFVTFQWINKSVF